MKSLLKIILVISTMVVLAQTNTDSVKSEFKNFNLIHLNSIQMDWNIINSPLLFYPLNTYQYTSNGQPSLYSLYTDSQINSGLNFELQPDVMLNQFRIANNWEAQKKYGVFAKYLGITQFMGVVGLAAIHISKFNPPPKGKSILKNDKIKKP